MNVPYSRTNKLNVPADMTVCFTGHRPKGIIPVNPYAENNRAAYQRIVDELTDIILSLCRKNKGTIRFISGGAQGFDQLAFWAVLGAKKQAGNIMNDVFVPFIGQELRWAKTGPFSRDEYQKMLSHADHIGVCTDPATFDVNNFRMVTQALMYRNECMVNASNLVIGQYAGDSWKTATRGGTAACLKYAKSKDKTILVRPFSC